MKKMNVQWDTDAIQLAGVVLLTATLHIWNSSTWHPLFRISVCVCFFFIFIFMFYRCIGGNVVILWEFRRELSQSAETGWF